MKQWNAGRETSLFSSEQLWLSSIRLEKEEAGHMAFEITQAVSFLYMKQGSVLCQINQKQVEVKEGEGVFLNGGTAFRILGVTAFGCEVLFLGLAVGEKEGLVETYVQPILQQTDFPWYKWERRKDKEVLLLMEKAEYASGLQMLGILCGLLDRIEEEMERKESHLNKTELKEQEKLKGMLTYLHRHYSEHLTLEGMAERSGVSKGEYCRFFKKHTGQTPVEYLQQYRIGQSLSALTEKKTGMSEIAGSCGFGGSSYYAEIFKKEMGCSPGEYRKWYLSGGTCPLREENGAIADRTIRESGQDSMPTHLL